MAIAISSQRWRMGWTASLALCALVAAGCSARKLTDTAGDAAHFQQVATQIEYPAEPAPCDDRLLKTPPPLTIRDLSKIQYWDLELQEAIRLSLTNSRVLLDLGGTVLRSPETVASTYQPAIQESDPQYGPEAALSAFDANFSTSLFFEKNDRRLNNKFLGNLGFYQQDYDVAQAQITKQAVTGTQFAIRNIYDFEKDSNLGNEFPGGAYDALVEGELRHPLLQGGGVQFNRIAGPGARPGVYNGVLVARIRTDISLTDFEIGVRDFVSNVENAYWDLYYAYRDLDTKIRARDQALETWRAVHALFSSGMRGGEAEREYQAREQYFRFEEEVQNALVGRLLEGTRTNNGSSAGTFRGLPGVHVAERRLRLLMGIPLTDGRLIRPADEPSMSPVVFDWLPLTTEALVRREELRRQRWLIKSRELELVAAKNFLLPNLDFVGRYRFRGFGRDLIDSDRTNQPRFDNAFMDLTSGDFQEWQMGAEFSVPIGFRQAHAGVRNAELRITQARALLRQEERQIVHDLSDAVAETDRSYVLLQTATNRTAAAKEQLDALYTVFQSQGEKFFEMLDAQRRHSEAVSRYHQSRVEYQLAIRNVHFEKGSLLEYCDIALSEGGWPTKAYCDAAKRECRRGRAKRIDYCMQNPPPVSLGGVPDSEACPPQATPMISDPAPASKLDLPEGIPASPSDKSIAPPPPPAPPLPPAPLTKDQEKPTRKAPAEDYPEASYKRLQSPSEPRTDSGNIFDMKAYWASQSWAAADGMQAADAAEDTPAVIPAPFGYGLPAFLAEPDQGNSNPLSLPATTVFPVTTDGIPLPVAPPADTLPGATPPPRLSPVAAQSITAAAPAVVSASPIPAVEGGDNVLTAGYAEAEASQGPRPVTTIADVPQYPDTGFAPAPLSR